VLAAASTGFGQDRRSPRRTPLQPTRSFIELTKSKCRRL